MSEPEGSHQEAVAIVSDAPIDVDDLPSDAEASTSKAPPKSGGPGRKKGKATASGSNDKDAASEGLESFLLPKSKITKIAKSALPPNTKLRKPCLSATFRAYLTYLAAEKEVPTALTRSAVVFISYLTSLAQEQAAAGKVKTIKPEHVLEALPELDWGEADTARLRKDLKKQLKAFRANAKAKKEGKPLPGPSTTGRPRGRPPKKAASAIEIDGDEEEDAQDQTEDGPDVNIEYNSNGHLKKAGSGGEESSDDEEDNVNITRLRRDDDGDAEEGESAVEDDIEEDEEEDEEDEEEEEDDIEDADEADPRDFEEEMGRGLDDKQDGSADEDMQD